MPEDYSAYLEAFPNGLFAGLARNRIRQLGGADADSRLTNVARGNPPTERPTNIRKTPNFAEFYKENSNRVLLELNHFLSTKYSTGGRSLNVSQIWKHRVAEKELPKGGKSGTWIWMSFDVQQGPRNVSSQEGYFLLEVRGDALLVHDAQGLEF